MSFSERMGLKPAREVLQISDIDGPLRIALFNFLYKHTCECWFNNYGGLDYGATLGKAIWTEFLRKPVDTFSGLPGEFSNDIKQFVLRQPWNCVYDLIEFCLSTDLVVEIEVNFLLERDMSGYRIRDNKVVPITDAVELSAIDEALSIGDAFNGAREHLRDALAKLARRPEPDLRNAITEAVSAVESAARIVTSKPKTTLSDALKVLEKNGNVHPALRDAWLKMYAYTSDEHGLRHAMTEDPNIDFPTAKYMVVACSAFVNLLSAIPPA